MKIKRIFNFSITVLIIFIALLLLSGCCCIFGDFFDSNLTEADKESDKVAKSVDPDLVNINTGFALDLFADLSEIDENSNVFISPLSISLMMTMAYNGAQNHTRNEIAEAIQFDNFADEQLNSSFATLLCINDQAFN